MLKKRPDPFCPTTDRTETRSLSLSKGPHSFVRNELRIWKPTLNGISCLTSLMRKRRNNVWIVNMYLKNLCLRFRLVKICNKKLCSPPQERTVAYASGSEWVFSFRGSASVFSVKFRVNPWQMLLLSLLLILPSVANASAYAFATLKSEPFRAFILIKIGGMGEMFCFFYWHPLFIW